MNREELIARAKPEHDKVCSCDPKYLMSCPKMAAAILSLPNGSTSGEVIPFDSGKGHRIIKECEKSDEPYFVFRAKDFFSVQVLAHYQKLIEDFGPSNIEFQEVVSKATQAFKDWQRDNMGKVRYPD